MIWEGAPQSRMDDTPAGSDQRQQCTRRKCMWRGSEDGIRGGEHQVLGRVLRGTEERDVCAHYMLAADTVEEELWRAQHADA